MDGINAVEMKSISKQFGSVQANEKADLTVKESEIHGLLGENGAGKSTLMNMLSGIYRPDQGTILIRGEKVHFTSPKEPISMGIGMIHQHFKLIDILTAMENIILGQKGKILINKKQLKKEILDLCQLYGLEIDPEKKVYDMSVSEKQTLEIIKVLYRGARILILDEPTAVLTPQETAKLFKIIKNMKDKGCSVIIITHKLNEIMEVCDQVTVLRKGKTIRSIQTKETSVEDLTEMMVGKSVQLSIDRVEAQKIPKVLEIKDLTILDREKIPLLNQVTFDLAGGEILGVAGIAGSGQKELCETIAGLMKAENGEVIFNNENILGKTPREIIQLGVRMGFIPEDRLGMGLVASMDMVHNLILKDYRNYGGVFLKRKHIEEKAKRIVQRLDIKTPGIYSPVKELSGGNIQKVLLGREIDSDPKVLITAYPVRGLDVGASYKIYDLLNEQKQKGVAVLFIGEDLDVILELCDRIVVLYEGKLAGIVNANETTKEALGKAMGTGKFN